MENEIYSSEPNMIAECYRNRVSLQIPRQIEKHFDFLEINNDGMTLLGTSNLNGRLWSGSIWIFEKCPNVPKIENCLAGIEFESTVASGLWLNKNKVVIGCDSGSLHHLTLNILNGKDKNYFTTNGIVTEHDDSIVSLDYLKEKTKIISGGMDMNIKVWDEETLVCEKSYCPAHSHIVTSVSAHSQSCDIFASTSLDGNSLIWDNRLRAPASLILKNENGYTTSTWLDEKTIFLGSNDGSVSFVDIRTKQELKKNFCSDRPIFKLKYNVDLNLLAVCSDNTVVQVFNTKDKNLNKVYESDQHIDFVRGLAWNSKILISCGWDSKIVFHNLVLSNTVSNKT